eukprot:SAG31_NODE_8556_length_1431_cov_1.081832_1_plen_108_part_00
MPAPARGRHSSYCVGGSTILRSWGDWQPQPAAQRIVPAVATKVPAFTVGTDSLAAGYDSSALAYQLPDGTDVVVGPRPGQYRRTVRSAFLLPPVGTRLLHWSTRSGF